VTTRETRSMAARPGLTVAVASDVSVLPTHHASRLKGG